MPCNKSKRTRTGCLCCRRRHKKCDEQRPSCKFCVAKGLDCEWPIKGSVFVTYKSDTSTNDVKPFQTIQFDNDSFQSVSPKSANGFIDSVEHNYTTYSYPTYTKGATKTQENFALSPSPSSSSSSSEFSSRMAQAELDSFPKGQQPLPSLTQYHFVIPRDHLKDRITSTNISNKSQLPPLNSTLMANSGNWSKGLLQTGPKRLSVDSLLN
jgi:hypothetical protein